MTWPSNSTKQALYYGIPCATLLAQDLRRSRSQGSREPSASQVIRDLCVFVSVLSWVVSPDHGDYRICKDAERRLSRMVDDLLDPLPTNTDIFPDPMVEWIDYDSLELGSILFS